MEVDNLSFHYHSQKVAIQDVSLCFPRHKITTILGPNGSGKSTLLKLLSGNLRPQKGKVILQQQNLHKMKPKERGKLIAYLPQRQHVPADLTVEEFVAYGRFPHQTIFMKESIHDRQCIEEALQQCELTAVATHKVSTLSGGQFQRAALALVLAQETPYLLLDEPNSAMDVYYDYHFLRLIRKLQQAKQLSVIMVLHQLQLAYSFSDYLVLMKEGRLLGIQNVKEDINLGQLQDLYDVPFSYLRNGENQYVVVDEARLLK